MQSFRIPSFLALSSCSLESTNGHHSVVPLTQRQAGLWWTIQVCRLNLRIQKLPYNAANSLIEKYCKTPPIDPLSIWLTSKDLIFVKFLGNKEASCTNEGYLRSPISRCSTQTWGVWLPVWELFRQAQIGNLNMSFNDDKIVAISKDVTTNLAYQAKHSPVLNLEIQCGDHAYALSLEWSRMHIGAGDPEAMVSSSFVLLVLWLKVQLMPQVVLLVLLLDRYLGSMLSSSYGMINLHLNRLRFPSIRIARLFRPEQKSNTRIKLSDVCKQYLKLVMKGELSSERILTSLRATSIARCCFRCRLFISFQAYTRWVLTWLR